MSCAAAMLLMGASRRARHIPFPAHTSTNRAMTNPFILLPYGSLCYKLDSWDSSAIKADKHGQSHCYFPKQPGTCALHYSFDLCKMQCITVKLLWRYKDRRRQKKRKITKKENYEARRLRSKKTTKAEDLKKTEDNEERRIFKMSEDKRNYETGFHNDLTDCLLFWDHCESWFCSQVISIQWQQAFEDSSAHHRWNKILP